jgi:hypothetical protein
MEKNYKSQITNKVAHELHELTRIAGRDYTIKSFCGGVQGGQFFQKAPPLAAGGKRRKQEAEYAENDVRW